jgi:hypothetical protein
LVYHIMQVSIRYVLGGCMHRVTQVVDHLTVAELADRVKQAPGVVRLQSRLAGRKDSACVC